MLLMGKKTTEKYVLQYSKEAGTVMVVVDVRSLYNMNKSTVHTITIATIKINNNITIENDTASKARREGGNRGIIQYVTQCIIKW